MVFQMFYIKWTLDPSELPSDSCCFPNMWIWSRAYDHYVSVVFHGVNTVWLSRNWRDSLCYSGSILYKRRVVFLAQQTSSSHQYEKDRHDGPDLSIVLQFSAPFIFCPLPLYGMSRSMNLGAETCSLDLHRLHCTLSQKHIARGTYPLHSLLCLFTTPTTEQHFISQLPSQG